MQLSIIFESVKGEEYWYASAEWFNIIPKLSHTQTGQSDWTNEASERSDLIMQLFFLSFSLIIDWLVLHGGNVND